jgi:hypothetical protein
MLLICPKCRRNIEPRERNVTDKKGVHYKITQCPYDRCHFNIDIEKITVKLWNKVTCQFEDLTPTGRPDEY